MQDSKHTISTSYIKRKQMTSLTPFDSYNSLTKQRQPQTPSYLASSRKKTNRSLIEADYKISPNSHLCLQHSLSITSVCLTCNFALICSECSKQSHLPADHDIRSVEKSSLLIKNMLIHSQIKLEAKCNILTNINEQLKSHKIQLFTQKNDYKEELDKTFEYLHQLLNARQKQMIDQIEQIYQEHDKKFQQTIDEIKSLQGYYDRCQKTISSILEFNTQNSGDFPVCHFYSQRKDILQDIVKNVELSEFKKHIYEVKYKIQNGDINSIIKALNEIQVSSELKFTYFDPDQATESRPSSLKKVLNKVKSENQLKAKPSKKKLRKPIKYLDLQKTQKISFPDSRLEKQRQSHKINGTFCTSTPKQGVSHEKKFEFLKKSPEPSAFLLKKRKKSFAKMISMPASPAKEDKEERFSPSTKAKDLIIEGMKKKTNITKKKK